MTPSEYRQLDNSIESFKRIKQQSEKLWEKVELEECWGYQIQEGSKWKKGLTEEELGNSKLLITGNLQKNLKHFKISSSKCITLKSGLSDKKY